MKLKLGILDLGNNAYSASRSVQYTLANAVEAEQLGYSRYWLAEHQSRSSIWGSPELLLPLIAARTSKIRVGVAGILFRYYNSFKVANDFSLLSLMFPNRIDLGLSRAKPSNPANALALLDRAGAPPDFDRHLDDLLHFFSADWKTRHPFARVLRLPPESPAPTIWLLGSSSESASIASRRGLSYSHSYFLKTSIAPSQPIADFVTSFARKTSAVRGRHRGHPLARRRQTFNVAVAGLCAPTARKAKQLLAEHTNPYIVPTVIGDPEQCRSQLLHLQQSSGVAEIMFLDICHQQRDKEMSYRLLAEACSLHRKSNAVTLGRT